MNRLVRSAAGLLTLFLAAQAQAHDSGGYSHDSTPLLENPSWMKYLSGNPKLSELSLPGTHDTMAYRVTDDVIWAAGGAAAVGAYVAGPMLGAVAGIVTNEIVRDIVQTQSMDLATQLRAGVRVLDIRIGHANDRFRIHHGPIDLKADFGEVMETIDAFLADYPSEAILVRLKKDHDGGGNTRSFATQLERYMGRYGTNVHRSSSPVLDPTLQEIRGKILILDDFPGTSDYAPMQYDGLVKQDDYTLGNNWDLYGKWLKVKGHFRAANASGVRVNYLSASGGSFPYFVASGHVSPGTDAARLATGRTTPGWADAYPDFPRTACFFGICTISFEGTNELTMALLRRGGIARAGIVMADFPGFGLLSSIVELNALNADYLAYYWNGNILRDW